MRIYNTALTQAQIQTDMTTPVTSAATTVPAVTSGTPVSVRHGRRYQLERDGDVQ